MLKKAYNNVTSTVLTANQAAFAFKSKYEGLAVVDCLKAEYCL